MCVSLSFAHIVVQFAQRTRNIELGTARKMIYYRNVDETVGKMRHDVTVLSAQKEALQVALTDASAAKKKVEDRLKAISNDAKSSYETRERMLMEEKRLLRMQLDDVNAKLRQDKAQRQVRSLVLYVCMHVRACQLPSTSCLLACRLLCFGQEEQEEYERMREKVRLASLSATNHAKEAKAMEMRAGQLGAEVERIKMLLLVHPPHSFECCALSGNTTMSLRRMSYALVMRDCMRVMWAFYCFIVLV